MDLLLVVVLGLLSVFALTALVVGLRGNSVVDTEGWHRRLRVLRETAQPDAEPVTDEELVRDLADSNVRLLPPAGGGDAGTADRGDASLASRGASAVIGSGTDHTGPGRETGAPSAGVPGERTGKKRPAAERRTSAQKRETTKRRAAVERSRPQGRRPAKSPVDEEHTPPS